MEKGGDATPNMEGAHRSAHCEEESLLVMKETWEEQVQWLQCLCAVEINPAGMTL
jgi:hypothetical protein